MLSVVWSDRMSYAATQLTCYLPHSYLHTTLPLATARCVLPIHFSHYATLIHTPCPLHTPHQDLYTPCPLTVRCLQDLVASTIALRTAPTNVYSVSNRCPIIAQPAVRLKPYLFTELNQPQTQLVGDANHVSWCLVQYGN